MQLYVHVVLFTIFINNKMENWDPVAVYRMYPRQSGPVCRTDLNSLCKALL